MMSMSNFHGVMISTMGFWSTDREFEIPAWPYFFSFFPQNEAKSESLPVNLFLSVMKVLLHFISIPKLILCRAGVSGFYIIDRP